MNKDNENSVHHYPAKIISHAVWLYHRFTLSFRNVEDILSQQQIA